MNNYFSILCFIFFSLITSTYAAENSDDESVHALTNLISDKGFQPTPARKPGEGEGPFKRLIIRGVTVIDGTGAPPVGPADILIEGNRIVDMVAAGTTFVGADKRDLPKSAIKEINAHGSYVLPGIVDVHAHNPGLPSEYIYKLWLSHGVTTVRGVPMGPVKWVQEEKRRSEQNEIVAPRIINYQILGWHQGGWDKDWQNKKILIAEDGRDWVRYAKKLGVDGVKSSGLLRIPPELRGAIWEEARKQGMGSVAHLGHMEVAQLNALDSARLGLQSVTHHLGLFEPLYKDYDVRPWSVDVNVSDEQEYFRQAARQWNLIHERGSKEWNDLLDAFIEHDLYISPTLAAYSAMRDFMRTRNSDWHQKYTIPQLRQYFQPSRKNHGSFMYYWTTADEVSWKNFYRVWMSFLNDYKNKGGIVTVGADSGYVYNLHGFGTIQEMELLQEAGFHPLEVIRSATMHGAMELAKSTGKSIEYGVLRNGMLADMFIVDENPLENMKVLYGTGAIKLNEKTNKVERVGGIKYTIKDGIVYDAKRLLQDVADMVEQENLEYMKPKKAQ